MTPWTLDTVASAAMLWAEQSRSDPRLTIDAVAKVFDIPPLTLTRYISRQVLQQQQQQPAANQPDLPLGLANIGNICFATAVIQCLRALPGFVDRLVSNTARVRADALRGGENSERARQWRVANALRNLMDGVAPDCEHEEGVGEDGSQVLVGHSVIMPRDPDGRRGRNEEMLRCFRREVSKYSHIVAVKGDQQEQQDAEEFLSFLLELLHELFRVRNAATNDEEERRAGRMLTEDLRRHNPDDPAAYITAVTALGSLRWQRYLQQNSSMVTDLFCGQTVRGSQCRSCASLTCLHEEQRVISLTLDANKPHQAIAEALERFGHSEQLADANRVFCDRVCQFKTARSTQILLQRPPQTLVLQLQRFRHAANPSRLEKIDTCVEFPCGPNEPLDVTDNAFLRVAGERVLYRLVAVCAHVGETIDSGHYISFVRGGGGGNRIGGSSSSQWVRIDDGYVSVIDELAFRQETMMSAYLLFYAR